MLRLLAYTTYGYLVLSGSLHFMIDVVSQHLRGMRVASPETSLYYGLHTSYALSQVLFGLLGIIVAHHAPDLIVRWPMISLSALATVAWLAIGFLFIEYREPKVMVAIFGVLLVAIAVTTHISSLRT